MAPCFPQSPTLLRVRVSLQCIDPSWFFEENLIVQVLAPVGVTVFVLLWIGFTYCCYR